MVLLVTENTLPPWQLCKSSLGCLHIPRAHARGTASGGDGFDDKTAPAGAKLLMPRVELTLEVVLACLLDQFVRVRTPHVDAAVIHREFGKAFRSSVDGAPEGQLGRCTQHNTHSPPILKKI